MLDKHEIKSLLLFLIEFSISKLFITEFRMHSTLANFCQGSTNFVLSFYVKEVSRRLALCHPYSKHLF